MMNIYQRLNGIINRERRGIAKITGHLGGGSWTAVSQAGGSLILTGQATIGRRVFYDQTSRRILGDAPDLDVADLPLP